MEAAPLGIALLCGSRASRLRPNLVAKAHKAGAKCDLE